MEVPKAIYFAGGDSEWFSIWDLCLVNLSIFKIVEMYLIKQHLRHYKYVILFSQDRSFRILCSLIKGTKPLSIINDITLKVYLWSKFLFIICDVKLTNAFWWFEKYNEKKCFLNNYKNGLYLSVFWYLFVFTHICPLIW